MHIDFGFRARRFALFAPLALGLGLGCEAPPVPPPTPVPFGTISGKAFIDQGNGPEAIGGAIVEVYGSSERVTTEDGKSFVLGAVPLGTHRLTITHPELDRAISIEATLQAPFETLILDPAQTTLQRAATLSGQITGAGIGTTAYLVGGNALQQAPLEDDGEFTLANLPAGPARIGFSGPGVDTFIVDLTLGEGENDAPADIELAATTSADLVIAGTVELLEETANEGVNVILNDDLLFSTAPDGAFRFTGLAPGVYSIRAQRVGFRSAVLSSVALLENGTVEGLVPVSLSPGNDENVVAAPPVDPLLRDFDIEIDNPIAGTAIEEGNAIAFVATASDQGVPVTDITWTRQDDAAAIPVEFGTGELVDIVLPIGQHIITATATAADGAIQTDRIVINVNPFDYQLTVSILSPTGIEPIPEGVPLVLRAATTVRTGFVVNDADLEWSFRAAASNDPFTILGNGSQITVPDLPVGELELRIDASVDNAAATAVDAVTLSVVPIDFSIAVLAPLVDEDPTNPDAPPYFTDFGLPLKAQIDHSVQAAFEKSKLRWFNDLGGGNLELIATGLNARTFLLPAGAGTIRFEAEDDFGNIVSQTAAYSLQQINISVNFAQPEEFTNVLEGTAITAAAFYTHSLVDQAVIPESQLVVRYFSDVQGLLVDTTGATSFGINAQPQFDSLVPGTHRLTVSMDDGAGRIVSDSRTIDIRSPGVAAIPVSPLEGLVVFAGDPVDFNTTVTFDPEVAPIFTWKIDGAEFDAAWDDYGVDPNFPGRATVSLGAYTPNAGLFVDPRLQPGRHLIEFQVRLDDVDPGLGCVNIPDRSACFRRTIDFVDGDVELCNDNAGTPVNTTLTSAAPIVISGVARLGCRLTISGADLIIEAGARIILDRGALVPEIRLVNGSLTVGAQGNAEEVVIEFQGADAIPGRWAGILIRPSNGATPTRVEMANTTIRHAVDAINANSASYTAGIHVTELRDVTIEDTDEGIVDFCPDVIENVTMRGMVTSGVREGNSRKCAADRTWRNLTIEDGFRGIELDRAGTATLENVVLRGHTNQSIQILGTVTTGLIVRDSRIENSTNGIEADRCIPLVVEGTVFDNNGTGIRLRSCARATFSEPSFDVRRSVFTNNQLGISADRTTSNIGQDAQVHLSTFAGNVTDIDTRVDANHVRAEGNFFGQAGDNTTAGGVLAGLPAGAIVNLPRIIDFFDNANNFRVIRVDNPLAAGPTDPADLPVAYAVEPLQTSSYHTNLDGCVPLVADAPGRSIAVLQPGQDPDNFPGVDAHCFWFGEGPSGDPVGNDRVGVPLDGDGCWDTVQVPLAEGETSVALECTDAITGRVDQHQVRFLVDNSTVRGSLHRAATIWDSDVFVAADVVVPTGSTLTIQPGVTVTFAESDPSRLRRLPDYVPSQDDVANARFGALTLVDLFVDGTLDAIGSSTDPVVFKSAAAAPGRQLWGGIRVEQNASATLSFVEIESADNAVHGSINPDDPNTAPNISITDTAFRDVNNVVRGVCPTAFERINAVRSENGLQHTFCKQSLDIVDVSMTQMGNPNSNIVMNFIQSYVTNGPANMSVTFERTRISRDTGNRLGRMFETASAGDVGQIVVRNSTFVDFDELFHMRTNGAPAQYALVIEDSHLQGFDRILDGNNGLDTVNLTRTTVRDADHLFTASDDAGSITIVDSRFNDMFRPFDDFDLGSPNIVLSVTGSVFEDISGTVFDGRAAGSANTSYFPTISGNNYINANQVIFLDFPGSGREVLADLTGCFWGTNVESEIRDLINDPQTPTGVPAFEEGKSDFTGFSASALVLPNVPPQP